MPKPVAFALKGQKVLVAGGGLAGLTAARELVRGGAEVQLFEARARLGGRVSTVRDPGFDDVPLEVGGEFIDGEHAEIRELCSDYGLTLQQILREGFGLALDLRGRVQVFKGQRQIWSDYKQTLAREARAFEGAGSDWSSTAASLIARHSLKDLLTARKASDEVQAMAQGLRGFFLADSDQLSALVGVEQALSPVDPGHVTVSRIKGGNDRLIDKLAATKGLKIALHSEVKRIEHGDRGVSLAVAGANGKLATVKGDYLVMAAPAPVLRDLEFAPALPGLLRQALKALIPGPGTKAHLLFDRFWWRKKGQPNAWGSNLDTGALWEAYGTRPAILTLLAGGRASKSFRDLLEEGGPQRLVRRLSWLGEVEEVRDFRSTSWELDRFARAAYCAFGTDFKPEWRAELSRAVGRVVFAGDHTSRRYQGYMNGAVESGLNAARAIELMRQMDGVSSPPA